MKNFMLYFLLLFAPFVISAPVMAQTKPHTVTLHWTASVTPTVTHYAVYRGTTSGGPYVYIGFANGTVYTNGKNPDGTPLVEGQTYYYIVVAATDVKGQVSVNSNEANATIPVTVTIAPATNVTAVSQ